MNEPNLFFCDYFHHAFCKTPLQSSQFWIKATSMTSTLCRLSLRLFSLKCGALSCLLSNIFLDTKLVNCSWKSADFGQKIAIMENNSSLTFFSVIASFTTELMEKPWKNGGSSPLNQANVIFSSQEFAQKSI